MRFKQPRQHRWNLFAAIRSTGDLGDLGDLPRVADRNTSERLHPFGDLVDQLILLIGMFVEQQMKLIKGRPAHQPVMLLVQRIQNLGVCEDLVQSLAGVDPRIAREPDRKIADGTELLDFDATLVQPRLA
jgi:hypothetical protein